MEVDEYFSRKLFNVSFAKHKPIPSCAARECAEFDPFGHVVSRNYTNRCDPVEAMGTQISSGEAFIAPVLPHLLAPRGSIYTPSVSSVEDGITSISNRELQYV